MDLKEYYSLPVEKRRKIRRRKILIKRLFIIFLTVSITAVTLFSGIAVYKLFYPTRFDEGFIPTPFGSKVSKNVQIAEELKIPDWIDIDIIHKHSTARTGIKLIDIKNIVIHYVGNPNTTAKNNRDYFDKNSTTVSSHFVVGLEGEIIQCVPLCEKSAASNERNKDTISIEVCHPDSSGKYNKETYQSVIKLSAFLCKKFSLDENDIIRHYDITGKMCPKYYVENEDAWVQMKEDIGKKVDEY